MLHWAKKMANIGTYKHKQTQASLKRTSLRQRLIMTEELLLMEEHLPVKINFPPLFRSLSKILETRNAS